MAYMRKLWALQRREGDHWKTLQLFNAEIYAAAKAARLGPDYRVEPVKREAYDFMPNEARDFAAAGEGYVRTIAA